jgi:hypothetical protein
MRDEEIQRSEDCADSLPLRLLEHPQDIRARPVVVSEETEIKQGTGGVLAAMAANPYPLGLGEDCLDGVLGFLVSERMRREGWLLALVLHIETYVTADSFFAGPSPQAFNHEDPAELLAPALGNSAEERQAGLDLLDRDAEVGREGVALNLCVPQCEVSRPDLGV